MRRLAYLSSVLIVAGFGLVLIAQQIGTLLTLDSRTIAAALARDSRLVGKVWCWRDICPAQTDMKTAQEQLQSRGTAFAGDRISGLRWQAQDDPSWHVEVMPDNRLKNVRTIFLFPDQADLTIGDMILIFGQPKYVFTSEAPSAYMAWICFAGDSCLQVSSARRVVLRPQLLVSNFTFLLDRPFQPINTTAWRGLSSYHQVAPIAP